MKNKLVIVALIAVILAGGMVLISCGGCPGDGKCKAEGDFSSYNFDFSWCGNDVTKTKEVDKSFDCKVADQSGWGTGVTCDC